MLILLSAQYSYDSRKGKKHVEMVGELMNDKLVEEIPGVGSAVGSKLRSSGYIYVSTINDKHRAEGFERKKNHTLLCTPRL